MPILAEPVQETGFTTIEDTRDWARETERHLRRIPVAGLLGSGATFHDDEYLGDGEVMLHFNERGIRALCQKVGMGFDQLAMLETPTLASQVLNDLLQQAITRQKLDGDEFVLDEASQTIIGLVSTTYVGYTNEQFLEDIEGFLKLSEQEGFHFHEAYGINTELTVRFTALKRHGFMYGRCGQGEDRTQLGLDFKNSMVGTSSVRINYFLLRLVCTNGMMVPAATSINRVFHSGKYDSFRSRLKRSFGEVMRKIDDLQGLLETLGAMPFEPHRLAANNTTNQLIFDAVPGLKQTICDKEHMYLRYPAECPEAEKRHLKLEHDTTVISCIPQHYGGENAGRVFQSHLRDGATIFDFLNIFTEYAKTCGGQQKLDIEERTGNLAKYIAENARKFA